MVKTPTSSVLQFLKRLVEDPRLKEGSDHDLLQRFISHRVNNVENVFLEKPAPGVWRVIVAAHRIASDQNRGTKTWDQDFALVVSGVEPVPVPPKPAFK